MSQGTVVYQVKANWRYSNMGRSPYDGEVTVDLPDRPSEGRAWDEVYQKAKQYNRNVDVVVYNVRVYLVTTLLLDSYEDSL